jgi:Flp pilus assembly protein TadG
MSRQFKFGDDRGSIGIMVAALALALFAVVGLVVDGAGKARVLARADDLAAGAARAGAQAVDLAGYRTTGSISVNPANARAAAHAYLNAAEVTGTVTLTDGGRTLNVTVDDQYTPVFLSIVGAGQMNVTGKATVNLTEVQQGVAR